MIVVRFPTEATKLKALGYLIGRFPGHSWATGEVAVPEDALAPQGWLPLAVGRRDGDPNRYQREFEPSFILWAVLERDGSEVHRDPWGPERFSFLYIGKDGVETYQNIFNQNHCRPKVIALIQPGIAFGRNWTDFSREDGILLRTLLQNPAGMPDYLLMGTYRGQFERGGWYTMGQRIKKWITRRHQLEFVQLWANGLRGLAGMYHDV